MPVLSATARRLLCRRSAPPRNDRIHLRPRHRSTKRRLSSLELPREDAEGDAFVVQFFESNVAAEIFDVHTIMREEGIVGELIRRIREQLVNLVRAEFGFGQLADFLPVFQSAFAEEATDGQVHRVVGGDHVHAPDVNLLL